MEHTEVAKRFENVQRSKSFDQILDTYDLSGKKVLDLGCGYGEHLSLFGEGSLGITTTKEEVAYGAEAGIRIALGNVERLDLVPEMEKERFDAVWSNNLFEHLLAPHRFLNSLKRYAQDDSLLILGVPVVPMIPELMRFKKFRGALAISHINFFTRDTLRLTVERAGWRLEDMRPFIFKNAVLDRIVGMIAPHAYVIARNDASFKYPDKKLKEWKDDEHYAYVLETTGQ